MPDIEVAVKQTPFTATESPTVISELSPGALIVNTADVSFFSIAVIVMWIFKTMKKQYMISQKF